MISARALACALWEDTLDDLRRTRPDMAHLMRPWIGLSDAEQAKLVADMDRVLALAATMGDR